MKNFSARLTILILVIVFLLPAISSAQSTWTEPASPIVGQQFTVYYDDTIGTLPENSSQCWLHWGVNNNGTGWSAPPEEIWPAGSQISGDGLACQSPMSRNNDNIWEVTIDPTEEMLVVEYVFTDMSNNWDNNSGNNYVVTFVSGETVTWYDPEEPEPGDLVNIYYSASAGTLPNNATDVRLHWGMNEQGHGNWQEPPSSMWPENTTATGDGMAVQTMMTDMGDGIWMTSIQTNDTTYTLHYVATDGSNWDTNNGANWNIELEEPPPVQETWHTFIYDSRSSNANFSLDDISNVFVAGPFNNWSSNASRLSGPDENGVFMLDVLVPAGLVTYKFIINGVNWTQDPDNPLTDGSSYMNSIAYAYVDELPYFTHVTPAEGSIYNTGETVEISALVRPDDLEGEIVDAPTLTLNNNPVAVTFDAESGEMTATVTLSTNGINNLHFEVTDNLNQSNTYDLQLGSFNDLDERFVAIDPVGDDTGYNNLSYPEGVAAGSADLNFFSITPSISNPDAANITIGLEDITPATRVMLVISSDLNGFVEYWDRYETELAMPDWNGHGVAMIMSHPDSPQFNNYRFNRIITSTDPLTAGDPVTPNANYLENDKFFFNINWRTLESYLGSHSGEWYFAIYSWIADESAQTSGFCYEVGETVGASDDIIDPDVYDAFFFDSKMMQSRLLANYSGNRYSTFDNVGRGFAAITADMISEDFGTNAPQLSMLSRGGWTVREEKTVYGVAPGISDIILHQEYPDGEHTFNATVENDTFAVALTFEEGINRIWAEGELDGETGFSSSIVFDYDINTGPQPEIEVTVDGNTVTLDASATVDPNQQDMTFLWAADEDNPAAITINNATSSIATFDAPDTNGEYYVNLRIDDSDGNRSHARTLVTVTPDEVRPFDINQTAQWIRDAIVYEIFPRSYSSDHQLTSITMDMPRLAELGINAIWLMPIFPGPSGHGYAITDYMNIEEDYGNLDDFRALVNQAHAYGIKIILDLVINHTALEHRFMQDALAYGEYSQYWDFYDRNPDGSYTYYYDWLSLPNLEYDNPDVWEYFIRASEWWIKNYDVDGYRCDVAWGPQLRNPDFWVAWHNRLKTIKPEVFLLGEATATDFDMFDHRFDLLMDWNIHHEGGSSLQNIFPGPANITQLHDLVTNYGYGYPEYNFPFRFLENHDETRYISENTPAQTKLVTQLLFTIPGVPMLYSGQEVGTTSQRGEINWEQDQNAMYPFTRKLVQLRKHFKATRTDEVERISNSQGSLVYSIARTMEGEAPVISVMNFAPSSQVITVDVPVEEWGLDPDQTYYLSEIFSETSFQRTGAELASITTSLSAYAGRVYVIADTAVYLDVPESGNTEQPLTYSLGQNYPNPFNPQTTINFTIPANEQVKIEVYNIMGQRVRTLVNTAMKAGHHSVVWDGRSNNQNMVASGIYFYRIQSGSFIQTRKMVMMK